MEKIKAMKPKEFKIPYNRCASLYFCPNCNKGHQVRAYEDKCSICGVSLDWSDLKENGQNEK